ncbi:hypothetical protein N9I32_01195 [Porticoccaceae bacterium]|nr:hypothetical protein [Porticoccaceae bacterium]
MSQKLRFTIYLIAMGLYFISENWIFLLGWVLFEWTLVWNFTSRRSNVLFDHIMEEVSKLGFSIESLRSSDREGEFNFITENGRNIHLSIRPYKSEPENIGYFTYEIFSSSKKSDMKNNNTGLYDLQINLRAIKKEIFNDEYVHMD